MREMKILVVSDTHRKHGNLEKVLEREGPLDLVIHLGDAEGYEEYIEEICECPLEIVSGNSDFFSTLPKEKEIEVGGYHILITHGHYYYVTAGIEDIKKEAYGYCYVRTYPSPDCGLWEANYCSESGKYFLSKTGGKAAILCDYEN